MTSNFKTLELKMPVLLGQLKACNYCSRDKLKNLPQSGVYVFYENNKAVYTGRSNHLKNRIQTHGRKSAMRNSAALAVKIAKERMGITEEQTYKKLTKIKGFNEAFAEAKERIGKMKIC